MHAGWEAGRARYADVALTLPEFAAHVAQREVPGDALARHAPDLYLAAACASGDPAALATFERELVSVAHGAIRAVGKDAAFVDEACQRVRAHLLTGEPPRIAEYAARGPLRAWIGIAATRTALMMRRAQQRAKEVPVDLDDWGPALAAISVGDPELELLKQTYAVSFSAAFATSVSTLDARARAVLRMSFVEGRSIDEIGAIYAVHRATAARWITRACEDILTATRDQLARELALSTAELDRMTALVRSQLDVSLSQLLPASLAPTHSR